MSRRRLLIAVLALALPAGALLLYGSLRGDHPWEPATQPFRTQCESGACDSVATVRLGHFGETVLYAQPDVDDAVTQWAACVADALSCFSAGLSPDCVARSGCPSDCRERYATAVATVAPADSLAYLTEFERIFVAEAAPCAP